MTSETFKVKGMTCGHCAQAVTDEVTKISSVESVAVDLANGNVTVTSAYPLDAEVVASAVDEAGYELVR